MLVTVYGVVGPKKALPNVAGHLQASGMAMFRAAPEPVNLEPLIQSTIDWLDRRARADGSTDGSELPRMFRWGFRLWPARCLICSCAADLRYLDLCRRCLEALPFKTSSSREMVPLSYAPPVDEGLRALKFHGDWRWAAVFGALLAGWSRASGVMPVSLLVPMPLHPLRKAERGFNQAAQIARFAALWLGVAVDQRSLVRARPTRPQTSLSAAGRRDNVEGAFEIHSTSLLGAEQSTVIALIDDVRTTGATLGAASAALESRPGLIVQRWAVASTIPTNTTSPA